MVSTVSTEPSGNDCVMNAGDPTIGIGVPSDPAGGMNCHFGATTGWLLGLMAKTVPPAPIP